MAKAINETLRHGRAGKGLGRRAHVRLRRDVETVAAAVILGADRLSLMMHLQIFHAT